MSIWYGYDPGPTDGSGALVLLDGDRVEVVDLSIGLRYVHGRRIAIEMPQSFGRMHVPNALLWTAVEAGRMRALAYTRSILPSMLYRKTIVQHICGDSTAGNARVRGMLIDTWGGREKAIGRKKTPGPLYGVKDHAWQALAVALAARDFEAAGTLELMEARPEGEAWAAAWLDGTDRSREEAAARAAWAAAERDRQIEDFRALVLP